MKKLNKIDTSEIFNDTKKIISVPDTFRRLNIFRGVRD